MRLYVFLALVLAACSTTRSEAVSLPRRAPATDFPDLPPAKEPLHLVPGDTKKELTCRDLLTELARVTGVTFSVPSDLKTSLERSQLGLSGGLDVPAESAWSTAESLLVAHEYLLEILSREPFIVGLTSSISQARGPAPRNRAPFVSPESLSAWAEHPGFLIYVTLDLRSINTRDLSNSMRQMFTDPQTQQIIPMGNTQALLLCGTGRQVADLAHLLLRMDEAERERCDRLGVEPDVGLVRQPKSK